MSFINKLRYNLKSFSFLRSALILLKEYEQGVRELARITDDFGAGGAQPSGHEPIRVQAGNGGTVSVPHGDLISGADISRDGQDLILEAPDGTVVVVENYFLADPAPVIQTSDGQVLTPGMVTAFAHHAGPVTYAQAEGILSDASPVGSVKEVSGNATITRTDGTVVKVVTGTVIYQGDIVETDAEGAVNIVFIDESSFAVSQNARLAIDSYVFDPSSQSGETNFSMLRGVFVYTSGLIGRDDPDDVQIDTPKGSIGIRGTIIAGNVDTGEITVVEGAIVLRTPSGEEMTLATQFSTAKFTAGEIISMGTLDSGAISNAYSVLSSVSPSFFSTLDTAPASNDSGGEQAPENQTPEEQTPEQSPATDAGTGDQSAVDFSPESFGQDNLFESEGAFSSETAPEAAATGAGTDSGSFASAESAPIGTAPASSAPSQDDTNNVSASLTPPPPPPTPPPNLVAPVFANGGITFNMPENSVFGTAVGPVVATDADGNALNYSITAGNAGNVFSIDSTGTIRVNGVLDFETVTNYNLTVQASDGVHNTVANYIVNVTNMNDAPVLTPSAPSLVSVAEDATAPAGQTVASFVSGSIADVEGNTDGIAVIAADNTNGTWEFSIDAGTTWAAVPAVSGTSALMLSAANRLRFVPDLNFNGTADIGYLAWDGTSGTAGSTANPTGNSAFSSATDTATISVTPVNDTPAMAAATFSINENSAGGAAVGTIATATDVDLDTLMFSETGNGTGAGLFAIDSSGNITVQSGAVLNYEAVTSYTYEISVSDGNGGNATAMMTINVSDVLNETITGDTAANTLTGSVGDDTLNGLDGNDTLNGGAGNDALSGGNQNDILIGGTGNDTLDGGLGSDTADYSAATGAIHIDMGGGIFNDGMGGTDTLIAIETVIGSSFNDILRGESGVQNLSAGSGNDTLKGSGGGDVLDGGIGNDTADYSMYGFANNLTVTLNSAASAVITSAAGNDTLIGIENIIGTQGADTINGFTTDTAVANIIDGNLGNDHLIGGNDDTLIGGAGNDWLEYKGGVAQNFDLRGEVGADTITISPALNISNADGKTMHIKGGNGGGQDTLEFVASGAITLNPNGVQDIVQEIEVYSFQNSTSNTVNITFSDFMVSGNDGGMLTVRIDHSDNLTFNFNGLNYNIVGGDVDMTGGPNFIEFQEDGGSQIVRIEYSVNAGALGSITFLGIGGGALSLNAIMAGVEPTEGFAVYDDIGEGFAGSIAALGDLDGDGYDDLGMVKSTGPGDNGTAFILVGDAGGYSNMHLAAIPGWTDSGMFFDPGAAVADVGDLVISGIGDFNGDGVWDYVVGAPNANDVFIGDPDSGNIEIIDGATGDTLVSLKNLSTSDMTGEGISGIGDVNRDGYADILVGAPGANGGNGSGYIIYGNAYVPSTVLDVTTLGDAKYIGDLGPTAFNADPKDIEIYDSPAIGPVAFVMKSNGEINVVNLTDPAATFVHGAVFNNAFITGLAGYTAAGGATDPMGGLVDMVVKGNFLYILSASVSSATQGQITVLNITDPVNPVFVDSMRNASLLNATGIDVDLATGDLVVIQSSGGNGNLLHFDALANGKIATATAGDYVLAGATGAQASMNGANEVIINGNYAYVTGTTSLRVIDLTSHTLGANIAVSNLKNMYLDKASNLLYVISGVTGTGDLRIYDVSASGGSTPTLVGSLLGSALLPLVSDIVVENGLAYITTGGGVSVLDVSVPSAISALPALANPGSIMAGASALALDSHGYLHVVSTTNDTMTTTDVVPDGIRINGAALDLLGMDVSAAGDFNGDGISDFAITTPGQSGMGDVYLVMGDPERQTLDLGTDPGVIKLININVDHTVAQDSEIPVFYLGDMNGDGGSDIAVGHTGGQGQITVYWGAGSAGGGDATADLTINPGAGFQIIGGGAVGDFNGDGRDDAAIILQDLGNMEKVDLYVLYGKDTLPGTIDKTYLDNAANAFHMTYTIPSGADPDDFSFEVSGAGDLNGDGYADMAIGLPDIDADPAVNSDGMGGANDDADGAMIVVNGRGSGNTIQGSGVVNATANGQNLVGDTGTDWLHANAFSDVSFSGGGGQDYAYVKTANFNHIDGGAGHDYIMFDNTGTLDFSSFNREDIKRIEELDILPTSGSTVILTVQNIFDFMETSDNGRFRLSSQGAGNFLRIDNLGAGSQNGATIEKIAELLGADSFNTAGGYHELHFGGRVFEIDTILMPSGVDII